MKLAHILPSGYAEKFHSTDYHLLISFTINENERYADFYSKCSLKGEYVIVDNGTFEKHYPDSIENILKAVHRVGASEVVAPDIIESSEGTIDVVRKFLKELNDPKISVMGVPQGKNKEDWLDCYHYMLNEPRITVIGLSILALDLVFPKEVPPTMWRLCMLDYLYNKGLMKKPIHLLGIADNPREIKLISRENYALVRGCDSSSAYVHGFKGYKFDPDRGLSIPKIKEKLNFTYEGPLTEQQISDIQSNIETMNRWISE